MYSYKCGFSRVNVLESRGAGNREPHQRIPDVELNQEDNAKEVFRKENRPVSKREHKTERYCQIRHEEGNN